MKNVLMMTAFAVLFFSYAASGKYVEKGYPCTADDTCEDGTSCCFCNGFIDCHNAGTWDTSGPGPYCLISTSDACINSNLKKKMTKTKK